MSLVIERYMTAALNNHKGLYATIFSSKNISLFVKEIQHTTDTNIVEQLPKKN